jgi:hypothetical protein
MVSPAHGLAGAPDRGVGHRVLTQEKVQVHTMLTTVHDDAYSEHVDLKSMEEMRERVGRDARRDVT